MLTVTGIAGYGYLGDTRVWKLAWVGTKCITIASFDPHPRSTLRAAARRYGGKCCTSRRCGGVAVSTRFTLRESARSNGGRVLGRRLPPSHLRGGYPQSSLRGRAHRRGGFRVARVGACSHGAGGGRPLLVVPCWFFVDIITSLL